MVSGAIVFLMTMVASGCTRPQDRFFSGNTAARQEALDRDLLEPSVPQLEEFYRTNKYKVRDVVQWHLARIEKYNPIYRAVQNSTGPVLLPSRTVSTRRQRQAATDSFEALFGAFPL